MRYLGIDYGKRKIGLAISNGKLASPFKVIDITSLKDALVQVRRVVSTEEIDQLVVGVPESGEARRLAKRFIKELGEEAKIIEADETLSSYQAKQAMINLGKPRKKRLTEDAYSAALILQDYLDSIRL